MNQHEYGGRTLDAWREELTMKFQVGDTVRRKEEERWRSYCASVLAVGMVGDVEVIKLDNHTLYFDADEYELVSRPKRYTIARYNHDNEIVVAMDGDIVVASVYIGRPYAAKTTEDADAMLRAAMAAAPGDWVEEK